ncbi:hypothetical protein [Rhizobium leucaenae]|uniref:hypothetical protein n=1 Tax=Rhizobium leucaenae TaxID=29450 RepID=UPI0007EE3EDB|nr:hypothetical protein [Rhizobium leucaenae]
MRGTWEKQTGKYQLGENYRIGKIIVGSAFYRSGSRDDPAKYAVEINLPGIKNPTDIYTNIDDAKNRLERAVAVWFKWLEERP